MKQEYSLEILFDNEALLTPSLFRSPELTLKRPVWSSSIPNPAIPALRHVPDVSHTCDNF